MISLQYHIAFVIYNTHEYCSGICFFVSRGYSLIDTGKIEPPGFGKKNYEYMFSNRSGIKTTEDQTTK